MDQDKRKMNLLTITWGCAKSSSTRDAWLFKSCFNDYI